MALELIRPFGLVIQYLLVSLLGVLTKTALVICGVLRYPLRQLHGTLRGPTSNRAFRQARCSSRSGTATGGAVALIVSDEQCSRNTVSRDLPTYVSDLVGSGVEVVFLYDRRGWIKLHLATLRVALANLGINATVQVGFQDKAIPRRVMQHLDGAFGPLVVVLDAADSKATIPAVLANAAVQDQADAVQDQADAVQDQADAVQDQADAPLTVTSVDQGEQPVIQLLLRPRRQVQCKILCRSTDSIGYFGGEQSSMGVPSKSHKVELQLHCNEDGSSALEAIITPACPPQARAQACSSSHSDAMYASQHSSEETSARLSLASVDRRGVGEVGAAAVGNSDSGRRDDTQSPGLADRVDSSDALGQSSSSALGEGKKVLNDGYRCSPEVDGLQCSVRGAVLKGQSAFGSALASSAPRIAGSGEVFVGDPMDGIRPGELASLGVQSGTGCGCRTPAAPLREYRIPGQVVVPTSDPRSLTTRLLQQRTTLLQDAGYSAAAIEPDFAVVLGGRVLRTWGYPPWQLRVCEVYWLPRGLWGAWYGWKGMRMLLEKYQATEQRLGK